MNRPWRYFILALVASPFLSYGIYRLAKGLGFLDPPWNKEHEHRRTIVVALFAFVLFFSIFLFGYSNAWPRVWAVFGVINGIALLIFAAVGLIAARRLWRLRHPEGGRPASPAIPAAPPDDTAEKPLV
ncbi:MAG TPA: hypothetical protein VGL03_12895 [Thermoanaerobaculia bacterium]|jgi:polyferredoxin